MPNQAVARALEPDAVGRLARFFPDATPVRIPIKLSSVHNNGNGTGSGSSVEQENVFLQETVIEFGTPKEVLFAVSRPLEFADRVLVESHDGALRARLPSWRFNIIRNGRWLPPASSKMCLTGL